MSLKGQYQAKAGDDWILGYRATKQEAIDLAIQHAKEAALQGRSTGSAWYVGLVVDTGSNTEYTKRQMGDGTGRMEGGYDHYDVVVTSVVAFGSATYDYSRQPAFTGSQGRAR